MGENTDFYGYTLEASRLLSTLTFLKHTPVESPFVAAGFSFSCQSHIHKSKKPRLLLKVRHKFF